MELIWTFVMEVAIGFWLFLNLKNIKTIYSKEVECGIWVYEEELRSENYEDIADR